MTPFPKESGSESVDANVQARSQTPRKALSHRIGGAPIDSKDTMEMSSPSSQELRRDASLCGHRKADT